MSNERHHVTIEGTGPDRKVKFTCTAEPTADCRSYPMCDCEFYVWNDAGTHDQEGHVRVPGQECITGQWFAIEAAVYAGDDGDDVRDDYAPEVGSGPITTTWLEDYPEWDWKVVPPEQVNA